MATVVKWSGDDVGGFDSELSQIADSIIYEQENGETHLAVTGTSTQIIGWSTGFNLSEHSARLTLELSEFASSSRAICHPLDTAGNQTYQIILTSSGTFTINNSSNSWAGATYEPISLNTKYTLIWWANATEMEFRVYETETGILHDTASLTGRSFGAMTNFRVGQLSGGAVTIPRWKIYDILLDDTYGNPGLKETPEPIDLNYPRVGIIGDSLTSMSGADGQFIYDELQSINFPTRNVYLWGVGGKRIREEDITGRSTAQNIADARVQLGEVNTWIVALGTNDRVNTTPVIASDIDALMAEVGSDQVIWINLTSKEYASTEDERVNTLLLDKQAEYHNFKVADWNTYIRAIDGGQNPSPYWLTVDSTHMSTEGYLLRAEYYVSQLRSTEPAIPITLNGKKVTQVSLGTQPVTQILIVESDEYKTIWSATE